MREVRLPARVSLGYQPRNRLDAWVYALRTTNPPQGYTDVVTRWIVITRAAVLPMTLTAGLVAAALAARSPRLSVPDLVLALVGITLAHVSNNLMNDLFDVQAGSDTGGYPRARYAPHPVLSGMVTRAGLVRAALAVNLADLAILIALGVRRGPVVVAFALAGFLLSVAYTAPPVRLKKRGLGELDVLVVWGPLMVGGTYLAATGTLPWQVVVASLPYGLLCTAVLMGKHVDKIPFDAPLGVRTLPVLLGQRRALALTRGLMVAFYPALVLAVAVGALPWPALLALGALPLVRTGWHYLSAPPPQAAPPGFPIWPLWYAAVAFVHTSRAGALLVAGLVLAAVVGVPR